MSAESGGGNARGKGGGQAEGIAADPVSRPALERLQAQRAAALPALVLAPPGLQRDSALAARTREMRIRDIEDRLAAARGRAVTDFALGGVRGKVRRDHERSR